MRRAVRHGGSSSKIPAAAVMLGAALAGTAEARVIALFPVQNRAGDSAAAATLDASLRRELARHGELVTPEATRDTLRRLRLRNGDQADPATLARLGEALGAEWLVSATLHDASRLLTPIVCVSVRVYASASGELEFVGFESASGIDRRTLLGLGTTAELEPLTAQVVRELLKPLAAARKAGRSALGTVAIVPFGGETRRGATAHAETVTEAARTLLFEHGLVVVSPNRAHAILRRLQAGRWGGVTSETRASLRDATGADSILTGAVETYELAGAEQEPEPRVAVALRLLDAASGRILWTAALEREGWDRGGLFRLGRVYSRGELAERILDTLVKRLEREGVRPTSPGPD